jgi:hypothetical protein
VARRVVVPDAPDAPDADAVDTALAVDAYVAKLPHAVQREVSALLQLVEHGALLHGFFRLRGSRFSRMSADEQDATLRDWESSSLTVRRRGFQALRTLAFLGYWRDDRTWSVIGYTGPMLPRRP